ncbi:MAG: 16S rRNA (cytosine(967)-C(5))-methyltransferase RsmB [Pseudomonadota bacterium]
MSPGNVRAEAARLLTEVLPAEGQGGRSLSERLPPARARSSDAPLLQEIVYGVCRYYNTLSWLANRRLQKPLAAKDRDIELLLLVGIFQLLHTRIPDHAAIGETVAAARTLGKDWATGFLNAVLRRIQREREDIAAEVAAASPAVRLSHPQWLVEMLQADWPQDWEAVLAANNARPPFCLRVNTRKVSRADYLARLHAAGREATATTLAPDGIRLAQACDVFELPGFAAGLVSVQDEAAQLCADLFGPLPPGARLLDACAAPGGKTAHLAERFPDVRLLALDIDERRSARIHDNLERLGLAAEVRVADAAAADWWDGEPFDAILLDAPCSASGVIRRHPDSKWLRKKGDIAKLARQQRTLLDALWQKLRPGGTLVYATCSVLREENERVVAAFAATRSDVIADPLPADRLAAARGAACEYGWQLLPADQGPDGFFLCRLRRAV